MNPDWRPQDMLPLDSTILGILMSVADESRYGYSIANHTRAVLQWEVPNPTIYKHLGDCLDDRLIEEDHDASARATDKRRRYFRITDRGAALLIAETDRLSKIVALAQRLSKKFRGENDKASQG